MDAGQAPFAGGFPALTTDRLVLREIRPADAPFWMRNFSAPEVEEFTGIDGPADLVAAEGEIDRYCTQIFRAGTGIRWGITLRGNDELIGTLGYHGWVADRDRHARMGYDLLAEHRGRGIMMEAMRIVLAYGFKTMTLNRAEALVDPRNAASIRLLERLGFQRDAYLRQSTRFRGTFQDDVVFSLLAREWQAGANR